MANSKPRVLIAAGIYPPDAGGPAVHAKQQWHAPQALQVGSKRSQTTLIPAIGAGERKRISAAAVASPTAESSDRLPHWPPTCRLD